MESDQINMPFVYFLFYTKYGHFVIGLTFLYGVGVGATFGFVNTVISDGIAIGGAVAYGLLNSIYISLRRRKQQHWKGIVALLGVFPVIIAIIAILII